MTPEPTEAAVEAALFTDANIDEDKEFPMLIDAMGLGTPEQLPRARIIAAQALRAAYAIDLSALQARVEALEAELRLAREDAERYRWLKFANFMAINEYARKSCDEWDAAIDAARQESANG